MRYLIAVLFALSACDQSSGTSSSPQTEKVEVVPLYSETVAEIARGRKQLARRLARAGSEGERSAVIAQARTSVSNAIVEELLPRWRGTPWAMNGTTKQPGAGKIACGYFVATILQDAGFELDRVRFGQAAALRIQNATTPPGRKVHRFYSIPANQLTQRIAALGDGVYIIGLDVHVGFVVVDGDDVRLVHASYTDDRVVTDEPLATARAIERSRPKGYFVSELLSNDAAIVRWIEGQTLMLPA